MPAVIAMVVFQQYSGMLLVNLVYLWWQDRRFRFLERVRLAHRSLHRGSGHLCGTGHRIHDVEIGAPAVPPLR